MFTTVDNSDPFARLIFVSDDGLAAQINQYAVMVGATRVNSPETMGGYRYPILEDMAHGDNFQIVTSEFPTTAEAIQRYKVLRSDPDTVYAYVDASRVYYIQYDNRNYTGSRLADAGWEVTFIPGGKTPKRVKTLNRPFRWAAKYDRPLHVYVVPDEGYSDLADSLEGFDAKDIESLLDGAFIINAGLVDDCRENIRFLVANETTDPLLSINHLRQMFYLREAADFVSFNARLFGPMQFSGDTELITNGSGMIKGEAYKAHFPKGFENVDVICAASALKHEVFNDSKSFVLLEPQNGKLANGEIQVFSDLQTVANNPALFDPVQVRKFTAEWVDDMLDHLKAGRLLSSWFDQTNPIFHSGSFHNPSDVNAMTRWNARAWAMSGMSYTQSPWLFMSLAKLVSESLRPNDAKTIRFPIPCAMRVLVITHSLARAYGADLEIERGEIRFCNEMEALVVHDEDWIEMRPSHGGHDLDDFFSAYYRIIDGQRKIILIRSPNDWGEYSIFDFVEGDYYPTWVRANGAVLEFPEISSDPALWPQRLSEAVAEGTVQYRHLPSEQPDAPKVTGEPHPYRRADVDWQVANGAASARSVGQNVNARVLWALCAAPTAGHRPIQLCSMEKAIDAGTQGGLKQDVDAVIAEAATIVHDIQNGEYPVDTFMWASRFSQFYGLLPARRMVTGRLTQLYVMRREKADVLLTLAANWAKEHCHPDPVVHELGALRFRQAQQLLIQCRIRMVNMQPVGQQALEPEHWAAVHQPILDVIETSPTDVDRHNFVIALWSACLRTPTASRGKITDQMVMNPQVFPYLLDALRYYGIAKYVDLSDEGQISTSMYTEWTLECDSCGATRIVQKPHTVQRYHFDQRICTSCRTVLAASVGA